MAEGAGAPQSIIDFVKRGSEGLKGKTPDARLQELADREEIRELVHRYAMHMAFRLSAADLFTEDGVFIVRGPALNRVAKGRAELEKVYGAYLAGTGRNLQMVHDQLISATGDNATSLCLIEVQSLDADGKLSYSNGYYDDRLRRVNGRWKFAVRDTTILVANQPPTPSKP